eukprot:8877887-Alexandrium_andersonii.AAC.1
MLVAIISLIGWRGGLRTRAPSPDKRLWRTRRPVSSADSASARILSLFRGRAVQASNASSNSACSR